ncbi:MAG: hypothetical protein UFG06_00805 [Lachnospiraceae bacterium]|nr:hypothetical protein [Lachnospiraceae bacterium]
MKVYSGKGMECIANKMLKSPNIQKYEVDNKTEKGFIASVEKDDGYEFKIHAHSVQQVYPSTIMQLIEQSREVLFLYLRDHLRCHFSF